MIELRLDSRLQGRLDASDVVQDALLDVAARLEEYLKDPKVPFFLWMRLVAGERLARLHRHHLGVEDARRRPRGFAVSRAPCRRPARSRWPRCCWAG